MDRRSFLAGLAAVAGGVALEKVIPFNRKWFIPGTVKPVNVCPFKGLNGLHYFMEGVPGGSGFFYHEWMLRRRTEEAAQKIHDICLHGRGVQLSEVGQWPEVLDSDCDPSRVYLQYGIDLVAWPESRIVLYPSSKITPVEIATELVQAASKSELPARPFRPSRIRRTRSLDSVVREFVDPIRRAVREALSSS